MRNIKAASYDNSQRMEVRIAANSSGTRAGFVVAAADVLVTAATVSVAVVAWRELRRNIGNNVKCGEACPKDQCDGRLSLSSALPFSSMIEDNNLGPKWKPVRSTTDFSAAHNQYSLHPHFTVEERRQALAHVKARVVQLRTLHDLEGLERHTTEFYSRRVSGEFSSAYSRVATPKICRNDEIRAVDLVPPAKHPPLTVLPKDSDERTESTEFSDSCTTISLLDISCRDQSESSIPDCDSATVEETPKRVLHNTFLLCSEALALVGCLAGAVTIVHV